MKWSENETIKFVEMYRDLDFLWDTESADYRNSQMRQAGYEHLVKEMGIADFTVADARKKIKSLRNTYSQELQKIERSLSSENGGNFVYKPNVKWFHIIHAFLNKTTTSERRSALVSTYLLCITGWSKIYDHPEYFRYS